MAEFNTGMSKVRQADRTLELILKAIKGIQDQHRDTVHYKEFVKQLSQTDPKHPVMNESNTAFYVNGIGPDKTQELLDKFNVPNQRFLDQKTGLTVVAVPMEYQAQANRIFAAHNTLSAAQLLPQNPEALQRLTANMMRTPSESVIASMNAGTAVCKTFDSARWMPLAQKMDAAKIPFGIVKNSKDGTTSLIFDSDYAPTVDKLDVAIEKTRKPAELSYADFMQRNLGQPIVERTGLSDGQLREFRQKMCGSCAEYNVQNNPDGTHTVRYNAKQAAYIEPTMTEVVVCSQGLNRDGKPLQPALDAHAQYVGVQAQLAFETAKTKQPMVIGDAEMTTKQGQPLVVYKVDEKGLTGPDGKIMVRRDDPLFAETVHSVTSQMKAPVVHTFKEGESIDTRAFTNAEIAAAKQSHAEAMPSDASVMASQLAAMKVTTELTKPNANIEQALNNTASFMQTLANGIEEENFRLGPGELKDEYSLHGPEKPEKVVEFEDTVHKLQPEEKTMLSEGLRESSKKMTGPCAVRTPGIQDLGLQQVGQALDREDHGIDEVGGHDEHGIDVADIDVPSLEGDM